VAAPLTLVPDLPAARPLQLSRPDIEGLSTALLDLGGTVEQALRTVMSMQRSLERIRRCDELSPEGTLLLHEMQRQVDALSEAQDSLHDRLRATGHRLSALRCEQHEPV
jgi:hypothetical protein